MRVLFVVVAASLAYGDPAGAAVLEEKIVFSSDRDGDVDIYSMDPDGSDVVQLTNAPGLDSLPAISPDGTRIAYVRCCSVEDYDVWLMNADGSDQHLFAVAAQDPTWSPDGTKVVFGSLGHGVRDGDIYAANADGTGTIQPIAYADRDNLQPALSADGTKIAWIGQIDDFNVGEGLFIANTDGSGRQNLTPFEQTDCCPDWRPDSGKLAYNRGTFDGGICLLNRDGTGLQCIESAGGYPSWSPSGTQIALYSARDGNAEIYKMDADGTSDIRLTNNPASDGHPDWGYLFPFVATGYPRPRGATPLRASLVPAFRSCTAPNNTHNGPLAFSSCTPPAPTSDFMTVGTPDANGKRTTMDASLLFTVQPGNPSTPADEADVRVGAKLNNVFDENLTDYAGELRANVTAGITDRDNGQQLKSGTIASASNSTSVFVTTTAPHGLTHGTRVQIAGVSGAPCVNGTWTIDFPRSNGFYLRNSTACGSGSGGTWSEAAPANPSLGTTAQFPFEFDIPCTATADTTIGSDCGLSTTAEALVPGAIKEGKRAIWQIGQVRVFDGGADGDSSTTGDNTVFATQGVFIP